MIYYNLLEYTKIYYNIQYAIIYYNIRQYTIVCYSQQKPAQAKVNGLRPGRTAAGFSEAAWLCQASKQTQGFRV